MQLSYGVATAEEIEAAPSVFIEKLNATTPFPVKYAGETLHVTEHEMLWIMDGTRFIGAVALRYQAEGNLINDYAGHLGLAIRPKLLNKGYGAKAILQCAAQVLARFKQRGFTAIIISCAPTNRASKRLIEWGGGLFVKEESQDKDRGQIHLYSFRL